jgi:hypothetical protein
VVNKEYKFALMLFSDKSFLSENRTHSSAAWNDAMGIASYN